MDLGKTYYCMEIANMLHTCYSELTNLLWTCYGETGVMDFGVIQATTEAHKTL